MRATAILALMFASVARSEQGIFNLKKPILLCQPPAPVCLSWERPICSQLENFKTGWVCKAESLIQKVALLLPKKAVDLVNKRIVEDYIKENPILNKGSTAEGKMMKGKTEKNQTDDKKTVKVNINAGRKTSNNGEKKKGRVETKNSDIWGIGKGMEEMLGKTRGTDKLKIDKETKNIHKTKERNSKAKTKTGMIEKRNIEKRIRMRDNGKREQGKIKLNTRGNKKTQAAETGIMITENMKSIGLRDNVKIEEGKTKDKLEDRNNFITDYN